MNREHMDQQRQDPAYREKERAQQRSYRKRIRAEAAAFRELRDGKKIAWIR